MEYIEPPPAPNPDEKKPKERFRKVLIKEKNQHQIVIQKAQVRDVKEILELVNGFAELNLMLFRGPQYLYENIRDFVIASDRKVPVYSLTETREVAGQQDSRMLAKRGQTTGNKAVVHIYIDGRFFQSAGIQATKQRGSPPQGVGRMH